MAYIAIFYLAIFYVAIFRIYAAVLRCTLSYPCVVIAVLRMVP